MLFRKQLTIGVLVSLFSISNVRGQDSFSITGIVFGLASAEPLPNAHVYVVGSSKGVSANLDGVYLLRLPYGEHDVVASYMGFRSDTIRLSLTNDTTLNFGLKPHAATLAEVTVIEERELFRQQQNELVISQKLVEVMPTLSGEPDIMKALQYLPGVSNGQEGKSALYVRGGGPDQNLILLDGVPVYNASHLFGYISVFNGNAISGAKLIKGGFPAKYGGRLSSVLEISLREGNKYAWKKDLTITPFTTNLMVEGPIKEGKSSIFLTGRASYFNWFLGALTAISGNSFRSNYGFSDWNARYTSRMGETGKLSVSFYAGQDGLRNDFRRTLNGEELWDETRLGFGNLTGSAIYSHRLKNMVSNHQAYITQYRNEIFTKDHTIDSVSFSTTERELRSGILEMGLKSDHLIPVGDRHRLNFGGQIAGIRFNPGSKEIQFQDAVTDSVRMENPSYQTLDARLYVEDEFRPFPTLFLRAGVHLSLFQVQGKAYFKPQPRLGASWYISDQLTFGASYTQMQQPLHLLFNYGTGVPTELWVSATREVKPSNAEQVSASLSYEFKHHGLSISLEAYHKTMTDLITFEDGVNFLDLGQWDTLVETGGQGEAYGLELLFSKSLGKITGWVGYTYSHTYRQFDAINEGNWFPYRFDRRHDVSVVATYSPKKNIELSAAWVYGTGNAITIETDVFSYLNIPLQEIQSFYNPSGGSIIRNPGDRNAFRMQASHRLDLGAQFTKEKGNGSRIWSVSVYNAYFNNNPYYYQTTVEDGKVKLFKVAIMPIIPSVSWRRKF